MFVGFALGRPLVRSAGALGQVETAHRRFSRWCHAGVWKYLFAGAGYSPRNRRGAFLTLPYGKFAHGIFRSAALLKLNLEKRLPNRLGLGSE